MKTLRKGTAILLTVLLAFACSIPSMAADEAGKPYSPVVHAIDNTLGVLHDGIFRTLQFVFRAADIPTNEAYLQSEQTQFYPGTDGAVQGSGWSAGFASDSVIPVAWRCDAKGNSDPDGWCIRSGKQATGGYQHKAAKIYSDQLLYLFMLSNGADTNGNGVPDLVLFVTVDGVGLTYGTVRSMRAGIERALAPLGVTADDILACNVSATHCHNALDIQGMSIPKVLMSLPKCMLKIPTRTLDPEMESTLVEKAGSCAKEAFDKMEAGTLSFFETDSIVGSNDRLNSGVRLKDWFSCFLFTGRSGEKTVLANLAKHPTSYWKNYQALFSDFPYYMGLAMQDAGYNFLFTQSAQATIYGGSAPDDPTGARDAAADAWIEENRLSYDDWAERYGESYARKNYDRGSKFGEQDLSNSKKDAFCLAQFILESVDKAKSVTPTLNVRSAQTLLRLDNGLMALGCITGLLGEHVVSVDGSESGYGIYLETNYMEIGDDVVILTAPGELSPAMLLGSDPNYTGDSRWTGVTSWTGEDWQYDTLENIVRAATGDSDKAVLLFGITNDAIGYVYPDECVTQSILGSALYRNTDSMLNNMLLTTGTTSGSQLMDAYLKVIAE